jgi:hypothetical protein
MLGLFQPRLPPVSLGLQRRAGDLYLVIAAVGNVPLGAAEPD